MDKDNPLNLQHKPKALGLGPALRVTLRNVTLRYSRRYAAHVCALSMSNPCSPLVRGRQSSVADLSSGAGRHDPR